MPPSPRRSGLVLLIRLSSRVRALIDFLVAGARPAGGVRAVPVAILCAAGLAAACGASAASLGPEDLVLVRRGTLPIILTAPHGGRLDIPGAPERNVKDSAVAAASRKWGGAVATADTNTDVLATRIADGVEKLTGRAPYLVVAKFKRKYIDANRPAALAYAGPPAAPYYELYHRTIRGFVDEVRQTHPAGLLLDVHGQAKNPDVIMRGTVNGDTVTRLVRRAGVESLTGPAGLFGQLEARGFNVFPSNRLSLWHGSEDAGFNGGYTVRTYGSQNAGGIDAVQLEFGTRYWKKDALDRSADDAARAIVAFYKAYLESAAGNRR
jgi:N-formylglutamate amidohydrolase